MAKRLHKHRKKIGGGGAHMTPSGLVAEKRSHKTPEPDMATSYRDQFIYYRLAQEVGKAFVVWNEKKKEQEEPSVVQED